MAIHVNNKVVAVKEAREVAKTSSLAELRSKGQDNRTVISLNSLEQIHQVQPVQEIDREETKETKKSLSSIRVEKKNKRKSMDDWLKRKDSEYNNLLIGN